MSSHTHKKWYKLMALAALLHTAQAATPCDTGYALTLYMGQCVCKHGTSVQTPNSACTYTIGDDSCTATCPTGTSSRRRRHVPQVVLNNDGSIANCPAGLVSCPISSLPDSRHECVNINSDLYNCGGCTATGEGETCGNERGVRTVSCDNGQCQIHSCRTGYRLDPRTHTCVLREL